MRQALGWDHGGEPKIIDAVSDFDEGRGAMNVLGQVLLWVGFLGGAFASVMRLENESAPWQTIPWELYLGGAAVGCVGVALIRRAKAARRKQSATSAAGMDEVAEHLRTA